MTNPTTPPTSPKAEKPTQAGPPPSPSIWTPVSDEMHNLSTGWERLVQQAKVGQNLSATPPPAKGRFFALSADAFPKTEPRPVSKGLRPEREISRRRLFPAPLEDSTEDDIGIDGDSPAKSEVSGCIEEALFDNTARLSLEGILDDVEEPGEEPAPKPPVHMNTPYTMATPPPAVRPYVGGLAPGQTALSPMALPPNTMLVPTEDPQHPGQALFRLMTVDNAYAGLTPPLQPSLYPPELMAGLGGPRVPMGPTMSPAAFYPGIHIAPNVASPEARHKYHCLVEFKRKRTVQYEANIYFAPGVSVIVGGDRGEDLGMVVHCWMAPGEEMGLSPSTTISSPDSAAGADRHYDYGAGPNVESSLGRVIRRATPKEVHQLHTVQTELERRCTEVCQQKVIEHGLVLQVIDAEYQFDRKKLTFYYDAQERQDFRDLVRDLYKMYRARIWMSKVGGGAVR